jgi:hypothetical protein
MQLNWKQIPSLTTSLLEYVYSRQHVSVLFGPSSGLTSVMSRAESCIHNYYTSSITNTSVFGDIKYIKC